MRLFAIAFLIFFAFWQHSQPPSPTSTPANSAHHNKGNPEQKETTADDQATKELTSAILQLRAEIATWNQQQLAQEREQKSSPDWWSIANTIAVTGFTGALAYLAYLQWKAMHRQADIYEKQANIADKQADIAAKQLAITQAAEALHKEEKLAEVIEGTRERRRSDERYTEQLELAKDNAVTAKKSADAATLTADTMMNAESARVDVEIGVVRAGSSHHFIQAYNFGRSAAEITGMLFEHATLPIEAKELGDKSLRRLLEKRELNQILVPTRPMPILNFDLNHYLSEQEREGKQIAVFFVSLQYRDIFQRQHTTEAVYVYSRTTSSLSNHPKYNRYA